jgi:hypothetical protein
MSSIGSLSRMFGWEEEVEVDSVRPCRKKSIAICHDLPGNLKVQNVSEWMEEFRRVSDVARYEVGGRKVRMNEWWLGRIVGADGKREW